MKGKKVVLISLDERLKDIKRIHIGSIGEIITTRHLSKDPERLLLVKFQGKAGLVSVGQSQLFIL